MNVLTLSDSAWDEVNSIGNTFSNLFSDWKFAEFSNIFLREANPNNTICNHYFRITDKMLLKNVFTPSKIGFEFSSNGKKALLEKIDSNEKKLISIIHRYNLKFVFIIERLLWQLKGWQNKKLQSFINNVKPDIVFSFALTSLPNFLLIKFLRINTNAKIVLFIADNVYVKYFSKKGQKKRGARRFREIIQMADKIYGASDEICKVYGKEFQVKIDPLYKGCIFEDRVKRTFGSPTNLCYAGNLLFGRFQTLVKMAKEIEKINRNKQKFYLKIYSGTMLKSMEKNELNIFGASEFCGLQNYDEIKSLLNKSDIVLHVESFDPKHIDYVKYSFSTKIIDCLQSGSVLMVIGPKGISSVEYSKKIPGTIVIDDEKRIEQTLQSIFDTANNLPERAMKIRCYAEKNHSLKLVHKTLQADFMALLEYQG